LERRFKVTWPQKIEADFMKTAFVRLDRMFRLRNIKTRIAMMIHDALWIECPEKQELPVRHPVRGRMGTAGRLRVPLEVEVS